MPTTDVDGSTESNGMKNDEDGTTTESVTMSLLEKKKKLHSKSDQHKSPEVVFKYF